MQPESLHDIEQRVLALNRPRAADTLRAAVLDDVQRELRAARWDRRFSRAAVAVVLVGIALNASVGWLPTPFMASPNSQPVAAGPFQRRLETTAVAIANLVHHGSRMPRDDQLTLCRRLAQAHDPWDVLDEAIVSGEWPMARRDAETPKDH